jgi:hypothetical protein
MEHREREQGYVREASAQAIVVDPVAAAPVGRRELAALVGALAGLAATSCVGNAQGEAPMEDLGHSADALTGANLAWVDTVLGAVPTEPPTPRPGDLATKNSANLGNATVVLAKGCVTAGDGGGGLFYWDTSPGAADDGGTVIAPTAGGGCWRRIFSGAMDVMWFGARGDGTALDGTADDDTGADERAIVNALAAAIAAGRPLTGGSRIYGVRGELVLPANAQLQDITVKQLSPVGSGRCTLTSNGGDNIKLTRVKVNRNGDGTNGNDSFDAAGIFITGGSGHHFEDVEVWGDDKGSGFVVWEASNFDVVRLHVHDIRYAGADPGDDRVQGFWFRLCSDFRLIAPKLHDLGGSASSSLAKKWSRNAFGGCSNFSVIDAQVWNVDQGIDLTGGPSNTNFRIIGGSARDCGSVGFKFANAARGGVVIGATTERCDLYGFFASGPSGDDNSIWTGNITFVDCLALDTGSAGTWSDPESIRPAGFAVEVGSFHLTESPLGIRFVNCTALDRQAVPTMQYGFANEVAAPSDGRYNECINCVSIGHTASPTTGMHRAFCQVKLTAPQSIPSGAWQAVNWNGEDNDEGAMHGGGTDKYIYARQPGLYEVIVSLEFAFNITGGRGFRLLKNDVPIEGTVVRRPPSTTGGDETRIVLTWQVPCAAGESLSVEAFQQSGAALNLTTGSRMIVTKIHNTGPA